MDIDKVGKKMISIDSVLIHTKVLFYEKASTFKCQCINMVFRKYLRFNNDGNNYIE
jgi:hypothetical protein